uniref:Uncharacterized protein n=1 Tax=Timema bartmani TaxID=61472 RepID=A0A7R9FAK7_9NEOP|nr:unnamed protein product [Timema bartmani]
MEWASFAYETGPFHSISGVRKAEFRGSVPEFAWQESGKPFWKAPFSSPNRDSNPDSHVIGSLVYCDSDALDNAATEACICVDYATVWPQQWQGLLRNARCLIVDRQCERGHTTPSSFADAH